MLSSDIINHYSSLLFFRACLEIPRCLTFPMSFNINFTSILKACLKACLFDRGLFIFINLEEITEFLKNTF